MEKLNKEKKKKLPVLESPFCNRTDKSRALTPNLNEFLSIWLIQLVVWILRKKKANQMKMSCHLKKKLLDKSRSLEIGKQGSLFEILDHTFKILRFENQ